MVATEVLQSKTSWSWFFRSPTAKPWLPWCPPGLMTPVIIKAHPGFGTPEPSIRLFPTMGCCWMEHVIAGGEASKFQSNIAKFSLCSRFISTSSNLQISALAQFKTSDFVSLHATLLLSHFLSMHFVFLFSVSKAIHPILSRFKNPWQLDARSCSKLLKLGALGPFILSFVESLNCEFPRAGNIFQHWTPNWLPWLFQVPIPELLSSFLSLKAEGIHSFLVHSGSSNTLSELIFTARFFFALRKHISFLKWVMQVQFRNDFSIATSPGNWSLFGVFDSNTFHTHHTRGLCCSGLDSKYTSVQRRTVDPKHFKFRVPSALGVSSLVSPKYQPGKKQLVPTCFSAPQLARLSCKTHANNPNLQLACCKWKRY